MPRSGSVNLNCFHQPAADGISKPGESSGSGQPEVEGSSEPGQASETPQSADSKDIDTQLGFTYYLLLMRLYDIDPSIATRGNHGYNVVLYY